VPAVRVIAGQFAEPGLRQLMLEIAGCSEYLAQRAEEKRRRSAS
jgi:hypothetical protein